MKLRLSWLLYGLGDAVNRLDRHLDGCTLYPLYNWLMVTSCDLQGDDPRGPWGKPIH